MAEHKPLPVMTEEEAWNAELNDLEDKLKKAIEQRIAAAAYAHSQARIQSRRL